METIKTTKTFKNDNNQAVRIPNEFRRSVGEIALSVVTLAELNTERRKARTGTATA